MSPQPSSDTLSAVTARDLTLLREDFRLHTDHDSMRFAEVRDDLIEQRKETGKLREAVAGMQAKLLILGGVAVVVIPLLTQLAGALFGAPHAK